MLSGTAAWKCSREHEVDQRMGALLVLAPASTPASSIWRKQLSATAAVGAAVSFRREDHLRGRARGVGDDDGPVALAAAAPENCSVYASSQPSTTRTPFARSLLQ